MLGPIRDLMGSDKYIIAAVHTLPLPGSPYYDREGGMKKIIARAKSDAKILADNGVQSFLFTNEADFPYVFRMPQEGVAAFSAVVSEVMAENTKKSDCQYSGKQILRIEPPQSFQRIIPDAVPAFPAE